jgi:hypothetical protein
MNSNNPDSKIQKDMTQQTELDHLQVRIDLLLRHTMAAPIPTLPSNFDQYLMRSVRRASGANLYHRNLLAIYTLFSVAVCAALMRGQGLGWVATVAMILVPLALVTAVSHLRNAMKTTSRRPAS